jgi:hypothetical protein
VCGGLGCFFGDGFGDDFGDGFGDPSGCEELGVTVNDETGVILRGRRGRYNCRFSKNFSPGRHGTANSFSTRSTMSCFIPGVPCAQFCTQSD